jgi:uncharacterized radical SAM superfamily Fe-S cluster-containing enzyme
VAARDRGEVFLEQTKSICPVCKSVLDAEVNARDGKIFLRKRCPDHGSFEALVSSDAELYLSQIRFNKPGSVPLEFQTEVREGCPLDCGLCPDHKQHTCLGLIEVNTACNLDCPICFADSGHQPDGYQLDRAQVAFMLDRFVAAEGAPEVIQFSWPPSSAGSTSTRSARSCATAWRIRRSTAWCSSRSRIPGATASSTRATA